MKALADIEKEYNDILLENQSESKNKKLVALMNILEKDYGTMKIFTNQADLDNELVGNEAVRLYAKISHAREF